MSTPQHGLEYVLTRLNLRAVHELCVHLPLRYEDKTRLVPLSALRVGDKALVEGTIKSIDLNQRGGRKQFQVILQEATTCFHLRWLNAKASWLSKLEVGDRLRVYGIVRAGYDGLEMVHPTLSTSVNQSLETALTPVYSTVDGLPEHRVRYWVSKVWNQHKFVWREVLPDAWLKKLAVPRLDDAIEFLHHPSPDTSLRILEDRQHPVWQRIKLDELIAQNIALKKFSVERRQSSAPIFPQPTELAEQLQSILPFALTQGQYEVVNLLWRDLAQQQPMHRLLQGDVGSGKTIVAFYAALAALQAGYPVAFMAPTDILATQIAEKAAQWLVPLGIPVQLLTGGIRAKAKREALELAPKGLPILWVGTHALFQEKVKLSRLGLVIIDEQHRFGVEQRLALRMPTAEAEQAWQPHLLMMSATPIPRTLAMSYYADLDVVMLTERPAQRQPIKTHRISSVKRDKVIEKVKEVVGRGEQVFWVCPLIEASEVLDLEAVQDTFEDLGKILNGMRVGLLHGRMSGLYKQVIMDAVRLKEIDVLVATTVIEVGIDIPNATLIVIDSAERFGLAQLHQLRGRVGRGHLPSMCILMYSQQLSASAKARLAALCEHDDGFEIARQDLRIRGPGELLGARQSGLPILRYADLVEDEALVEVAAKIAAYALKEQAPWVDICLSRWIGWKSVLAHA